MRRPPQRGDARRDAGEGIGARGAGKAHGRGRRVLLVVGVQDEDAVERPRQHRIDLIVLARHGEAHAQEVGRIIEVVLGINEGLADRIFIGHGGERRDLGDHARRGDHALDRVGDIGRVVIERRQRADRGHHDRHRMRVAAEALEEAGHLLMHHGVARDAIVEIRLLRAGRQFAIEQKIAGLQKIAVLGELLNRIAAIEQNALVAVDKGDLRLAARGRGEAGVVGEHARLAVKRANVQDIRPHRALFDGEIDRLVGDRNGTLGFGHRSTFPDLSAREPAERVLPGDARKRSPIAARRRRYFLYLAPSANCALHNAITTQRLVKRR